MYHPYPFTPFPYPPMGTSENPVKQLKQMIRFYKKMEKEEKEGSKKDDKKGDKGVFKSPFSTVQWLVLSCFFGPIVAPWFIFGVITSWQNATAAIKATIQ